MPLVSHGTQDIWYEEVGSGPPLVLGHSFLFSGAMWRKQVPTLAAGHRVINIDFRGHGRSGPVSGPFTLYDAVDDVIAVLDHLEIDRATWCGLSVGGMVALRGALTRPERVDALALLDTDAGPESLFRKCKNGFMHQGARMLGIKPFLPFVRPMMFGATTLRQRPPFVQAWQDDLMRLDVPSLLHGLSALDHRDSVVDRLPEILVPALVLVGEEDRALPPARSQRIADGLPNAHLVRIPGAGHIAALERADAVTQELRLFLSRLYPADP